MPANNVANTIVSQQLCSGCGVCGGVCPVSAIEIQFNAAGEYNPEVSDACISCGRCLKVCPFSETCLNEDAIASRHYSAIPGITKSTPAGYYLDCFAGFSREYRDRSASGGLLSFTLRRLFQAGLINKAVCVIPDKDSSRLFKFTVVNAAEALETASGSAYYPVEMSEVIREIVNTPGDYAITGLPCFIKAIRNIASENALIDKKIKFCLGLTCGQSKSKCYAEYLAVKAGLKESIDAVRFRGKDDKRPSSDIFHEFFGASGERVQEYWTGCAGATFTGRMFTLPACSYCDDVFAECADAAFMDAWLPEYVKDPRGTSLVLCRNPKLAEILRSAGESVRSESIENVLLSQAGVVSIKRDQLAYRLYSAKKQGRPVPKKRVAPSNDISFFSRKETEIKEQILRKSRELAMASPHNEPLNIDAIDSALAPLYSSLAFWAKIHKIWRYTFGRFF